MPRKIWPLMAALLILVACSSGTSSPKNPSQDSAPSSLSSMSAGLVSTGADGTWSLNYSQSRFGAWLSDFSSPPGAPTITITPSSPLSDYHAIARAEFAACTTFVQRLKSGNWTTSIRAELLHYAQDLETVICPQQAAQIATTSISDYLANAAKDGDTDRPINSELGKIESDLG